MEEWNRSALVSLQEKLKLNVRIKLGLMDKLPRAAGGFMSEAEAQEVESKQNNAEQMGELIKILLGKRNKDFKIFCSKLEESNYELWANELKREARKFKGEPGTHILISTIIEWKGLGLCTAPICVHFSAILYFCYTEGPPPQSETACSDASLMEGEYFF